MNDTKANNGVNRSDCQALLMDPDTLRPIVQAVVAEVLAHADADRAKVTAKLAYNEGEAAALLGLQPHQLRDERYRGRIGFSRIVGGQTRYTPQDLAAYLCRIRSEPARPI